MAKQEVANVTIRNAELRYKNFAGSKKKFNAEGERNFSVVLDEHTAMQLQADGWNVTVRQPHENDEDQVITYMLKVKVAYDSTRPPKVTFVTKRGKTTLTEDLAHLVDVSEFSKVDLIVRGYSWEFNGNSGIKAYLKTFYGTLDEDELDDEYGDLDDIRVSAGVSNHED